MPRSLARSSSRSVSGVAARSAAQSSRPNVRNRLPASITPRTLRSARADAAIRRSATRKRRGAYPTPHWLVDAVVEPAPSPAIRRRPRGDACSTRRAATGGSSSPRRDACAALGGRPVLVGVDIDAGAVAAARRSARPAAMRRRRVVHARRPRRTTGRRRSTSWSATRRSCRSWRRRRPAAAPAGTAAGRTPTRPPSSSPSPSGSPARRRAGRARAAAVDPRLARRRRRCGPRSTGVAAITWSWWSPRPVFDAQVLVCALVFERAGRTLDGRRRGRGADVVTGRARRPAAPVAGDRRDARRPGPPDAPTSATSTTGWCRPSPTTATARRSSRAGSSIPGRCRWGERPVTFAKRRFAPPDRRPRPAQPADAPLGRRRCSCPRCSSPTRPG